MHLNLARSPPASRTMQGYHCCFCIRYALLFCWQAVLHVCGLPAAGNVSRTRKQCRMTSMYSMKLCAVSCTAHVAIVSGAWSPL